MSKLQSWQQARSPPRNASGEKLAGGSLLGIHVRVHHQAELGQAPPAEHVHAHRGPEE